MENMQIFCEEILSYAEHVPLIESERNETQRDKGSCMCWSDTLSHPRGEQTNWGFKTAESTKKGLLTGDEAGVKDHCCAACSWPMAGPKVQHPWPSNHEQDTTSTEVLAIAAHLNSHRRCVVMARC